MARRSTATSPFGVSKRESHDASGFYARFTPPVLSSDRSVSADKELDKLIVGDARHMPEVPDSSVALVVTSPPYFAGKEYEASLGEEGVPGTYFEYLQLLRRRVRRVRPQARTGRPNRGKRGQPRPPPLPLLVRRRHRHPPGRSPAIAPRRDHLDEAAGLVRLVRLGELPAGGNPVLRDLTERIVVASKGRFDRAIGRKSGPGGPAV